MTIWRDFPGPNVAHLLTLFARYQENPDAVDETSRAYFRQHRHELQQLVSANGGAAEKTAVSPTTSLSLIKIKAAVNLAQAIREYGHLAAQLDPLGTSPPGKPTVTLAAHDLTEADLRQLPADLIGGPAADGAPMP